ncbi:MAG: hypothetical protein A2V70_06640 [Planctomycetes bacterium RBG_13_63_9]|nr:MAG: hypothetical protein A2V70_06640 [Planctomycetes bacterium RBG_13_63_9]
MTTIREIENAVAKLPPRELSEFSAWFEAFDAATWDKQFEADVNSGRLDAVARQAIEDFSKGKCKEL